MRSLLILTAALLSGCAAQAPLGAGTALPAVPVVARGETRPVGTANADAADDPAIWRDPADPSASLIVATDKKAGLYVYDLDGNIRSFVDAGRVNNVDLIALPDGILVAASDRNDPAHAGVALFRLDPAAAQLRPIATVPAGAGEGYGICLAPPATPGGAVRIFSAIKDGTILEMTVATPFTKPLASLVRIMKVPSQIEGCVADPATDSLYIGEEDVGIWRFPLSGAGTEGALVARVGDGSLVADVEGLAIARLSDGRALLFASSQGDSSYAVYTLPDHRPIGRFRIAGGAVGATSETDGIEVVAGDFGAAYPGGLFIAQDGDNAPAAQNFKLVALDDILAALRRASSAGE